MDIFAGSGIWASMLRIATPVTLAAMGGLLCQRAGVFNIALEGCMLAGAFSGIAVVQYTGGSVTAGMFGAVAAGMLLGAIFALSVVQFRANQIIAGIAVNMLCLGLTSYLLRSLFKVQGVIRPKVIDKLAPVGIGPLADVPFLGEMLGGQSVVAYLAIFSVFLVWLLLNKTEAGLDICAVGESPDAARTAGISPGAIQWAVILACGGLCGLAGSYLSTAIVSQFSENMVQGRGFNAFTAVVFGNANPIATWLVTLLFGLADAIGIRIELKGTGFSPSVIKMFPFALALAALAVSSYVGKLRRASAQKAWKK
ncbi:MAG: ABC transporter permease [Synergistaceae bacterium]|jgi:simple sugar transport system permease protein|nr:ABC transporter permease [Synergistaceae bacterium]